MSSSYNTTAPKTSTTILLPRLPGGNEVVPASDLNIAANGTARFADLVEHVALVQRLNGCPPELVNLTTREAAILLRCSTKTLEERRVKGLPPKFKKAGSKVLYPLQELLAFEVRTNTCR